MPEIDERIGPTAHYTAYVWHRLGLPYADLFATATGARLFWAFRLTLEWPALVIPRVPALVDWLETRHRTIDAELGRLSPDAVVEVAAGLSRRGVTWAADHGVRYAEVDLPHMVGKKRALLEARARPDTMQKLRGAWHIAPDDVLSDGVAGRLADELEGAARPVVVAEGLLGYFDVPDRVRILAAAREALAAAGGGAFLCDLRTRRGFDGMPAAARVLRLATGVVTRGRGVRGELEDDDAVRGLFASAGFDSAEPVPPATSSGTRHPGAIWRGEVRRR